jgi:hypothetical protein
MEDKKQLDTLKELTGLDFSDLEDEYKRTYDSRTLVNRQIRDVEGQLKEKESYNTAEDAEQVDVEEVRRQLDEARIVEGARNAIQSQLKEMEESGRAFGHRQHEIDVLIKNLQAEQGEISRKLADLDVRADMLQEELDATLVPDTDELLTKLTEASSINVTAERRLEYRRLQNQHEELSAQSTGFTTELEQIEQAKATALSAADMPIEDLGFDAEQVLYQGIPFKQCSSAEQLRVSLAMAMKLNPEIRVIRIQDASLLDKTNLKVIEEMAGQQGYQVWAEIVTEGPGLGIYIEDGQVSDGQEGNHE